MRIGRLTVALLGAAAAVAAAAPAATRATTHWRLDATFVIAGAYGHWSVSYDNGNFQVADDGAITPDPPSRDTIGRIGSGRLACGTGDQHGTTVVDPSTFTFQVTGTRHPSGTFAFTLTSTDLTIDSHSGDTGPCAFSHQVGAAYAKVLRTVRFTLAAGPSQSVVRRTIPSPGRGSLIVRLVELQ